MEKITKNMVIGELVQSYPETVDPLSEEGIHCIGCGASGFETLEQGLKGHGMDDKQVDAVVKKLNDIIKTKKSDEPITITENATKKIKSLLNAEERKGQSLRIEVEMGGCSGYQYAFSFDNKKKEGDFVFEKDGARIFIDSESMEKLRGITLDYVDSLQGAGFKISNPNALNTCGCGSSFN